MNLFNPLISVIVPVYNVQEYLVQCVESLVHQTYNNIEILLVDDGSTDDSGLICDKYADEYENIYVYHKTNGGLSSARNYGIDKANGEYLSFIDSDDFVDTDLYRILINAINDNSADVVIFGFCNYYSKEKIVKMNLKENSITTYYGLDANLRLYTDFSSCNKLYRKGVFDNIRFPEGKLYEDARTTYRIAEIINSLIVIPEYIYYYRQRETGIMGTFSTDNYLDRVSVWSEIYEFEKNKFSDEELQYILQRKNQLVLELIFTTFKNQFFSFDKKLMKELLDELHNPVKLNSKERIMMFLIKFLTIL